MHPSLLTSTLIVILSPLFIIGCTQDKTNITKAVISDKTSEKVRIKSQASFKDYNIEYFISGDETTELTCLSIVKLFPPRISEFAVNIVNETTERKIYSPNLFSLLFAKPNHFESINWKRISEDRKKETYLKTVPHKLEEYAQDGRIKNVSVTTVEKWAETFPERGEKFNYWEYSIPASKYKLYGKTNINESQPNWKPRAELTKQSKTNRLIGFPIYLEYNNIMLEHPTVSSIIQLPEYDKLFSVNALKGLEKFGPAGVITVRALNFELAPGERPYEINHPRGKRKIAGPLRHVSDDGCQFSLLMKTDAP